VLHELHNEPRIIDGQTRKIQLETLMNDTFAPFIVEHKLFGYRPVH